MKLYIQEGNNFILVDNNNVKENYQSDEMELNAIEKATNILQEISIPLKEKTKSLQKTLNNKKRNN